MSHILIVGGTGMLKEATISLSKKYETVSVIARKPIKLKAQEEECLSKLNQINLDYQENSQLVEKIKESIEQFGPISIAICWIHSIAPQVAKLVAVLVSKEARYFEIFGSAVAHPAKKDSNALEVRFPECPQLLYRKIILGFVLEKSSSRWLNHHEISQGVLTAVEKDQELSIVGTVTPWSKRP